MGFATLNPSYGSIGSTLRALDPAGLAGNSDVRALRVVGAGAAAGDAAIGPRDAGAIRGAETGRARGVAIEGRAGGGVSSRSAAEADVIAAAKTIASATRVKDEWLE